MATDMFLKLEGIKGESTDGKHKDQIDIQSWSNGLSNVGTFGRGGGGGAGKVDMTDLVLMKYADKSSPELMLKCASGQHIPSGQLTIRKAGGNQEEYYVIKLTKILVSSLQSSSSGEQVMESLTLNFSKIEYEYKPQKEDGSLDAPVKFGWDLAKNEKV